MDFRPQAEKTEALLGFFVELAAAPALGKNQTMEPFHIPIDGVLDLHTFRPAEVPDLLSDYIEECRNAGITRIRIIHGKGTGTLKRLVHRVLKKHPRVASFTDAPPDAGGWGATLADLEPQAPNR